MTIEEAIKILDNANKWRRDNKGIYSMPDPREFGLAIDKAIEVLSELNKDK